MSPSSPVTDPLLAQLGPDPPSSPSSDPYENAASGHAAALVSQLTRDPNLATTPSPQSGWTLLHLAARYGHARVAQALLARGADPHTVANGKTPRAVAEFWGHADVAQMLPAPAEDHAAPPGGGPRGAGRRTVRPGPDLHVPGLTFIAPVTVDRAAQLRTKPDAVGAMYRDPRTRFVALIGNQVLWQGSRAAAAAAGAAESSGVRYVSRDELLAWFPDHRAHLVNFTPDTRHQDVNALEPPVAFLGIDTSDGGRAYFGIDLVCLFPASPPSSPSSPSPMDLVLTKAADASATDMRTAAGRLLALSTPAATLAAGWLAQARSVLDWHARHRFCAGCGARTQPSEAGWRRTCPNAAAAGAGACFSGVQNFAYPRTDPVAMGCVIHPLGTHLLLGRTAGWPRGMYSCTAGFVEPGETLEAAVRREVKEETGVNVGAVEYMVSQPWPMPNSLMLGCMAQATSEQVVLVDEELEEAKWVAVEEVRDMVAVSDRMFGAGRGAGGRAGVEGSFCPPPSSIAGVLIREWLHHWAPVSSAETAAAGGQQQQAERARM